MTKLVDHTMSFVGLHHKLSRKRSCHLKSGSTRICLINANKIGSRSDHEADQYHDAGSTVIAAAYA